MASSTPIGKWSVRIEELLHGDLYDNVHKKFTNKIAKNASESNGVCLANLTFF